ncbi:hypothetical protein L1987_16558 [Smallanthus sonchifolius]|uniref:Uncharacterized protein n=1 Tax=Smallanthus sonchifolius TaxID=185202 RepID=A0ACB9JC64_9ASTR|nr:hypothetical protein L1987_16558 [Smallanthus sonchifolius]
MEEEAHPDGTFDRSNGGTNRKKYKIWSSKNRKPEKNISIKKHVFKTGGIPPSKQLLGFPEFRLGTEGNRASANAGEKTNPQKRTPVGDFYKSAAAVEERLSDTVKNINTSNGHRKLLNSVKSLPSCKISKFSARLNAEGEVCIDEGMVESEPVSGNVDTHNNAIPRPSYANMLSGQSPMMAEDKVMSRPRSEEEKERDAHLVKDGSAKYTTKPGKGPQPDNEGFTTVRRKKGGHSTNSQDPRRPLEDISNAPRVFGANPGFNGRRKATNGIQVKDRNIQNASTGHVRPVSSMANEKDEDCNSGTLNNRGENNQTSSTQSAGQQLENHGRTKHRKPVFSVIETTNRYTLLDENGTPCEENNESDKLRNSEEDTPKSLNEGWIKKQERNLNTRYASLVTQEQRFEAKRDPPVEEVESETDDMATLMKNDTLNANLPTSELGPVQLLDGHQHNQDMDMQDSNIKVI